MERRLNILNMQGGCWLARQGCQSRKQADSMSQQTTCHQRRLPCQQAGWKLGFTGVDKASQPDKLDKCSGYSGRLDRTIVAAGVASRQSKHCEVGRAEPGFHKVLSFRIGSIDTTLPEECSQTGLLDSKRSDVHIELLTVPKHNEIIWQGLHMHKAK